MSKGNVLINGRTAVHAGSKGVLTTVDVCLTQIGTSVVPIPYTNVAESKDADKTTSTVFINGNPVCHKDSTFSRSTGDEPGNKKGIRSGTIGKQAEFVTASPNVFIEGVPAVRQGDMMVSNNCNTSPMPLTQPGAAMARGLKARLAEELEAVEQPDRIDIGYVGKKTPLLKGRYRQHIATGDTTKRRQARYFMGEQTGQNYRELEIRHLETGNKNFLSLVFSDSQTDYDEEKDQDCVVIPLGISNSVSMETVKPAKPSEYANFTVPLILKCYTSKDLDKAKAGELCRGWVYVFCNGYLWRELQVIEQGFCKDVNLRRHQGKDSRPASGEADSRVIVPWKINNQKQTIEIVFSEGQWTWGQINELGGMNPDSSQEIRLHSGTALSKASKSDAASNRSDIMLDISDELESWILSSGKETENIQLIDDVTADIYSLQLHKQSNLPVVFLKHRIREAFSF